MRLAIFTIIWTLFWLVADSTILAGFPSDIVRCDFVFLAVVALGFSTPWREGFAPVAIAGMLVDGISPAPFFIFTILYLSAFSLLRFANAMIYVHSLSGRFFWTAVSSALVLWLEALILFVVYRNTHFLTFTLFRFIPQAVWSGLAGFAIIPLFGWYVSLTWERLTRPRGLVLR